MSGEVVMTIDEAASRLQSELSEKHGQGKFSVGIATNALHVYEHNKGYACFRKRPEWLPDEFGWEQIYIGKIRPAM